MAKRENSDEVRGESTYARKKKFCDRHGVYGFQVPEPKPWKSKKN
jgi:hypothetical protein